MLSDKKTVILEIIMQKWSLQYVIIISFSVFILSLCTDIILDVKLKDVIIESQQKNCKFLSQCLDINVFTPSYQELHYQSLLAADQVFACS